MMETKIRGILSLVNARIANGVSPVLGVADERGLKQALPHLEGDLRTKVLSVLGDRQAERNEVELAVRRRRKQDRWVRKEIRNGKR